jgi:hypothetical protein
LRLTIKGKIQKVEGDWEIHFPLLNLRTRSQTCKTCFDSCGNLLKSETHSSPFKFSLAIGESQEVFIVVDYCQEFFDYLSHKMTAWPHSDEWEKELNQSIRYHKDFED